MAIFRSNNPTTWAEIDQIVIDERAPTPSVTGVATNIAGYLAQFQRGPEELVEIGSTQEFEETFGRSSFSGNQNLKNKKFGRLRVRRVVSSSAAASLLTLKDGSDADILTLTASSKGAWGDSVSVVVSAGSESGVKIEVKDNSVNAVLPSEIYDNVDLTGKSQLEVDQIFAPSRLVVATVIGTPTDNLAILSETDLAGGSDGTVADTDYESALVDFEQEKSANFIFADKHNAAINGYLKAHAAATQDKMVIIAGSENDTVSAAIADVANYRDADGRIIYAYPWVQTRLDGVASFQSPASWMASLLSQTSPHIDPAYTANTQFLGGMLKLKRTISRAQYIQLKDGGIAAFEQDPDIGFKLKSGVVTQILNSSKVMIFRRRMADYLTTSVAFFLKNFQNAVNNRDNRLACGASIRQFIQLREQEGILPGDDEVQGGLAKIVDVETLNTDDSIALGYFKILWKQRIFSSMRYIVLTAEIGESVVVREGE